MSGAAGKLLVTTGAANRSDLEREHGTRSRAATLLDHERERSEDSGLENYK